MGPLLYALKLGVGGGWWLVGVWVGGLGGGDGLQYFSVSPRPLGFRFGTKGFGA